MSSDFLQTERILETISKDFLCSYKWLIYSKQSNIEFCIENTNQIVSEAIFLRKLYFKQIKSKIGLRLARKCSKWHAYYKAYGIENERTTKYFRRLIHAIADTDDDNYDFLENFLFNDKENENDEEDFYEGDHDDDDNEDYDYYSIVRTRIRDRVKKMTMFVSTGRPMLDTSISVSIYSDCDTLDIHDEQEKEVMEDTLDIHDEQEKQDLQENYDHEERDDKQCEKRGELENDKLENYTSVNMDTDKKCPAHVCDADRHRC